MLDTPHFLQTLIDRKREMIIGTSSVLAGITILIVYFQSGPNASTYAKAQSAFQEWQLAPEDEKLYKIMREAILPVPDLQRKYEPVIAQKLLDTHKIDQALAVAGRSLQRVKKEVPLHAAYGETSLLIEQGNFQKALENAVALKEQMGTAYLSELKAGSVLYVHNLLRIACLQQRLQNRPGEKSAWDELDAVLRSQSPVSDLVLSSFTEKKIDLVHYIAERKKHL